MRNSIKTWIISTALMTMPLNVNAENFFVNKELLKNKSEISLYENLNSDNFVKVETKWSNEVLKMQWIDYRIVTDAALSYFDDEVKMFKLSKEAKDEIVSILYSYLSTHPVLMMDNGWRVEFVIDNKREFSNMVKQFSNVIIGDMPFFIRKVIIPVLFGGNDALQYKLNNLDGTVMNMKEKQYKDVVFDYLAWIIKRVVVSVNWNMMVWDYYNKVVNYYPNKHSAKIMNDLDKLWLKNQDIKNLKYPFK